MTAVLSPTSSSSSSSPHPSTSPNPNLASLPPLVTTPSQKRPPSGIQRPSSYALNRISQYSTTSNTSQKQSQQSRPTSFVMAQFHSSLPYTEVRDFAYPSSHPLHYGPPAEPSAATSGRSTPAFEFPRRLSDPPTNSWNPSRLSWSTNAWGPGEQLPQMAYGGSPKDHGPPYSEDEDLQSPVVVSSRSRKGKEGSANYDQERGYFAGANGDGSETYYVSEADETANGPGGELVTYPPEQARHSSSMLGSHGLGRGGSGDNAQARLNVGSFNTESRYSRDYSFSIASPDEEMHGKAVALFDFARENENELPLVEGQVIWVSYRHGQGWLVAEDPRSGESGLVPETYVRLLRDIEGGWAGLSGDGATASEIPEEAAEEESPDDSTQQQSTPTANHKHKGSDGSTSSEKEKKKPIVSTFSTSSKDLDPYPINHAALANQSGQQPPQVVHYGSQSNTPTVLSPAMARKGSDKGNVRRTSSRRKEKEKEKEKEKKEKKR